MKSPQEEQGLPGGQLSWTAGERDRLVRLCATITGQPAVAEDMAQETLLGAWRHADRLHDREARQLWLNAIARNVCRRWRRKHWREATGHWPAAGMDVLASIPSADDPVLDIEQAELRALLDGALMPLPATTRTVLAARYLEDRSYGEIAADLGLTEGAVALRLYRGKRALRQLLLSDQSAACGQYLPAIVERDPWRETRIWCPHCGDRRLHGRLEPGRLLTLRCPACDAPVVTTGGSPRTAQLLAGARTIKPAFNRVMAWGHDFYRRAMRQRQATCGLCGSRTEVHYHLPYDLPGALRGSPGIHLYCRHCRDGSSDMWLSGLVLWLPESRRFWQEHPRLRVLPHREIEHEGMPALITQIESVTSASRLEVVSARDDYRVLSLRHT